VLNNNHQKKTIKISWHQKKCTAIAAVDPPKHYQTRNKKRKNKNVASFSAATKGTLKTLHLQQLQGSSSNG